MFNKQNISFNTTDCPSEQLLKNYQAGILTKTQIREVELHLADCEMCSDFVEGLSLLSNANELKNEASIIVNQINKKGTKKNKIWLYATAASIFIAIALSSLILFLPTKNNYVADSSVKISQKNENPAETKQQSDLSWKKNESETSVDEISGKKQLKKVEKPSGLINTMSTGEKKSQNFRAQEQTETSEDIVTINNEPAGVIADVVAKESVKSEIVADKSLAEKDVEMQDKKEDESVSFFSKVIDNDKSKKSEEKVTESPNKNAPEMLGQGMLVSGAASGYANIPSDLDNANYYLLKQKADSAIVYALRGTNSTNDSIKWKSKLCLAKAYLAKGEKEKAIEILKEIKQKAKGSSKKDAEKELKTLGY